MVAMFSLQAVGSYFGTSQRLLAERRGSIRFPCDLSAACQVEAMAGEWLASVQNVSCKGIGLVLPSHLPVGSVLTIRLKLPAGRTFIVRARIVFGYYDGKPGWYHGCAFLQRLSVDEVEVLLS